MAPSAPAAAQESAGGGNASPSIIDFLGLPKLLAATKNCAKTLGEMPLTKFVSDGVAKPMLQSIGLMPTPGLNSLPGQAPSGPMPSPFAGPAASNSGTASGGGAAGGGGGGAAPTAPPPAPPAALTAQIAAANDPAAEAIKIEALQFLSQQDTVCYPETIDTILAALDDCSEAVRYAALRALWHSQNTAVCVICRQRHRGAIAYYSCPCELKTITRISQLLLTRDRYGRLLEGSPRVRNLARIILTECIAGRTPLPESDAPVPDPPLPAQAYVR